MGDVHNVQIQVSGFAPFSQRWMKRWAVALTTSQWRRHVASMDMESPLTQFFYVSRKRVVSHALRQA